MQSTEDKNSPNLMWEINVGMPLIIAFAGMAVGLNELANFEFVKTANQIHCSKIFCRDPHKAFYHRGINADLTDINALLKRLKELIGEMAPSRISCVGVSAGGYAALLFGHLLKADTAHAFGPQVMLYKQWGLDHNDPTVANCWRLHEANIAPENDFRNLPEVLKEHNGKTAYHIHVGRDCEQDLNHVRLMENLPYMNIHFYAGSGHACAAPLLKEKGILGQVIIS